MFKIVMICAVIGLTAAVHHPVEHHPLPHHVDPHPHGHAHHGGDVHADVVSRSDDVRHDGFDSSLKTTNDIYRSEHGDEHGNIHGDFGWVSPEGEHVDIKYVADEHGYQPSGAHVHPIPDYILRSIAWNAAHHHEEPHHDAHHGGHHGGHH